MNTDHVTVRHAKGGYLLECSRCRAEEYGRTPIEVRRFCAEIDRFMTTHRECAA